MCMNNFKFVKSKGQPNKKDYDILCDGMLAYHAQKEHPRKSETFSIFLKNKNNKVFGAVIVTFLWDGMEINSLWIDETIRNQGWGSKLMDMVEKEAKKRKAKIAYTNTFSWQAPKFYEKIGYKVYGKLDDFPKGSSLSYYCKIL